MNLSQSHKILYSTITALSVFLITSISGAQPFGLDSNSASSGSSDYSNPSFIGKVFHDMNGDGIQDNNEKGIPGIRLATVSGITVETDGYGRFHIEKKRSGVGSRVGSKDRNFILKIDNNSLPIGASLTTENPRVINISSYMVEKVNFGIHY